MGSEMCIRDSYNKRAPLVRLFNKICEDAGQGAGQVVQEAVHDDEVSWTTRTWSSLMAQRMSVALHMAAAWEIARELSLAGAEDEAALFGLGRLFGGSAWRLEGRRVADSVA